MRPIRGWKHSPESKQKMRMAKLGRPLSDEHKRKLSLALKGRVVSKKTREKLSACIRTPEQKEHYRQSKLGEKHWRWNGGRAKTARGYILAKAPIGHPFADMNGRVMEHRLVAEKVIGRFLKPTEVVHHVNGKLDDNRNANLVICQDNAYHLLLHRRARDYEEQS